MLNAERLQKILTCGGTLLSSLARMVGDLMARICPLGAVSEQYRMNNRIQQLKYIPSESKTPYNKTNILLSWLC